MAGAGIGFLLGPASTDAVNRAISASYGEVTGITQTLRNYGSSFGMAVLGTVLGNVFASTLTDTLVASGMSAGQAAEIAAKAAGEGDPTGGSGGTMPPEVAAAVAHDFAVANQAVFYGMAAAVLLSLLIALAHPGGRVTQASPEPAAPEDAAPEEAAPDDPARATDPTS